MAKGGEKGEYGAARDSSDEDTLSSEVKREAGIMAGKGFLAFMQLWVAKKAAVLLAVRVYGFKRLYR